MLTFTGTNERPKWLNIKDKLEDQGNADRKYLPACYCYSWQCSLALVTPQRHSSTNASCNATLLTLRHLLDKRGILFSIFTLDHWNHRHECIYCMSMAETVVLERHFLFCTHTPPNMSNEQFYIKRTKYIKRKPCKRFDNSRTNI